MAAAVAEARRVNPDFKLLDWEKLVSVAAPPRTRNGLRANLFQRGARQGCRDNLDSELHGRREARTSAKRRQRQRTTAMGDFALRPLVADSGHAAATRKWIGASDELQTADYKRPHWVHSSRNGRSRRTGSDTIAMVTNHAVNQIVAKSRVPMRYHGMRAQKCKRRSRIRPQILEITEVCL